VKLAQYCPRIIGVCARIQYGQDAATKKRVQASFALVTKLLGFDLRQNFKTAFRPDFGIDSLVTVRAKRGSRDYFRILQIGTSCLARQSPAGL
jgi:hypothetical protein